MLWWTQTSSTNKYQQIFDIPLSKSMIWVFEFESWKIIEIVLWNPNMDLTTHEDQATIYRNEDTSCTPQVIMVRFTVLSKYKCSNMGQTNQNYKFKHDITSTCIYMLLCDMIITLAYIILVNSHLLF